MAAKDSRHLTRTRHVVLHICAGLSDENIQALLRERLRKTNTKASAGRVWPSSQFITEPFGLRQQGPRPRGPHWRDDPCSPPLATYGLVSYQQSERALALGPLKLTDSNPNAA